MDDVKANEIIKKAVTNLFEMRGMTADLEVLAHQTFSTAGLDVVADECVQQLREALEALNVMQAKIKAAGRALVIDMPGLAMKAEAA